MKVQNMTSPPHHHPPCSLGVLLTLPAAPPPRDKLYPDFSHRPAQPVLEQHTNRVTRKQRIQTHRASCRGPARHQLPPKTMDPRRSPVQLRDGSAAGEGTPTPSQPVLPGTAGTRLCKNFPRIWGKASCSDTSNKMSVPSTSQRSSATVSLPSSKSCWNIPP